MAALAVVTGVVLAPASANAVTPILEPAIHYGAPIEQQRVHESNMRLAADVGFLADETSRWPWGVTLHATFGSQDARFAVRPRLTWNIADDRAWILSAGYIFHTSADDSGPDNASMKNSGMVAGVAYALTDLLLQVETSTVTVGPTTGFEGGTEVSFYGGVGFRRAPGAGAALFGLGVILALSVAYAAAL